MHTFLHIRITNPLTETSERSLYLAAHGMIPKSLSFFAASTSRIEEPHQWHRWEKCALLLSNIIEWKLCRRFNLIQTQYRLLYCGNSNVFLWLELGLPCKNFFKQYRVLSFLAYRYGLCVFRLEHRCMKFDSSTLIEAMCCHDVVQNPCSVSSAIALPERTLFMSKSTSNDNSYANDGI